RLTTSMKVSDAKSYLLHGACDWYTPLKTLLAAYHDSPQRFARHYFLPTLYQHSSGLLETFPPSSYEFGGIGYPYEVKPSEIQGMGVFATRLIMPNEPIGEYWGTKVPAGVAGASLATRGHYCITVRDGLVIDAADVMCPMKYVNHSCSPNAFVQVVGDGFIYRAKTPIKCGSEITIDYAHSAETEADLLP
ncbi:hypothetical protein ADUPG1_004027, partial [Aduncisulcus paluster]